MSKDRRSRNTSSSRTEFARRKFCWLEQVAADNDLAAQAPPAMRVAVRLASHLNEETFLAYPGYRTIANDLGLKKHETVIGAISALEARGHLVVAEKGRSGRGKSNKYRPIIKDEEKVRCDGPFKPEKVP